VSVGVEASRGQNEWQYIEPLRRRRRRWIYDDKGEDKFSTRDCVLSYNDDDDQGKRREERRAIRQFVRKLFLVWLGKSFRIEFGQVKELD
jgi:hypothetical protein